MAKATTERVAVWLTPDQVAWLKTRENVSVTLRALVNEAMNMKRLADSLKRKEARKAGGAAKAADPAKSAKSPPSVKGKKPKVLYSRRKKVESGTPEQAQPKHHT